MKRFGLLATVLLLSVACYAQRVTVSPDSLFVESRGQTALNLGIWVPAGTGEFQVGVFDQGDEAAVGKPSTFRLLGPDGKAAQALDAGTAQGWHDYTVQPAGRWGQWTLAVAGPGAPAAAEGQPAPNPVNSFMVRTTGEVDLFLMPEATPKRLAIGAPKFGGETTHRYWVQSPDQGRVRVNVDAAAHRFSFDLPAGSGAVSTTQGTPRGGIAVFEATGNNLPAVVPFTVAEVAGTYRIGVGNGARLHMSAQPALAQLAATPVRTTVDGVPGAARVAFVAPNAPTITLFTNRDGEGAAYLLPGVDYVATASHGLEFGRTEAAVPAGSGRVTLDVQRAIVRPTGWVCGDTHMHSMYSDGVDSPSQMVEAARAEGLDFHFLSDHGTGTDLPNIVAAHAELEPLSEGSTFLALPATEYTLRDYHANVLGENFMYPANRPLQEVLDEANSRHQPGHPIAVHLNHPFWTGTAAAPDLARALERLPMIELFNSPEPAGIKLWWELLNKGMRVPSTATTDSHGRIGGPVGARRTYLYLDDEPMTLTSVIETLRAGRSFLSFGAVIESFIGGQRPGGTIPAGNFEASFDVQSASPIDRVELIVNGEVASTVTLNGGTQGRGTLAGQAASGWAVIQVLRPDNDTPLAITNPVYIGQK